LVVDLGSGGGFPGIVLGCARPDLEIALVESRRRRASFLGEVIRSVPIPHARVVAQRLDGSAPPPELASRARVAVGRGLRVEEFLDLAAPLLAADGMALSMQVPAARKQASAAAARAGYRLTSARDYCLPDGTPRSLLLFVPDRPRSWVS
jgi:16S rRNA (guanine527-N7)-methyltransferase